MSHVPIVHALRALADALLLVAPRSPRRVEAIRRAANQLESSGPSNSFHADLVRMALEDARDALATGSPRSRWRMQAYADKVEQFSDAVIAIDPRSPLQHQGERVERALEAAVETIQVAVGTGAVVGSP